MESATAVAPTGGRIEGDADEAQDGASSASAGSARRGGRLRALLGRPVVAAALLLLVYLALASFMSPEGFLGTDTAGKVATVKVMSERGDFDPDVGYWAAEWDPEARVHGLYYTSRVGDRFVQVTSLPLVLVARPLWDVGGYRATLLLPMLGGLGAALAARALARRLGDGDGWTAYWVIGLASPVTIYSLDLWEHSLGLALMAWAAVALHDAVERRPHWWRGLVAGAMLGAAAAMRTEAFVYALAMTAVACLVLCFGRRRSIGAALRVGAATVVGFALMFGANLALETAVLGEPFRSSRAGGAATAGGSMAALRVQEALTTLLAPAGWTGAAPWLLGGLLALALGYGAVKATEAGEERRVRLAAAMVAVAYLAVVVSGLGFVPGMVAATPFVAVGVALGWRTTATRLLLALAIVPLPLVFAFQYVGGAGPQWAGRYLLPSGLLAAVVGIVESRRMLAWARTGLIVLSVGVTAFGLAWLSVRSHGVAGAGTALAERQEDVLIAPDGFVAREFGATYGQRDWLAAGTPDDVRFAVDVAAASGAETFALVVVEPTTPPPDFDGWIVGPSDPLAFLTGTDFVVTTYCRSTATETTACR